MLCSDAVKAEMVASCNEELDVTIDQVLKQRKCLQEYTFDREGVLLLKQVNEEQAEAVRRNKEGNLRTLLTWAKWDRSGVKARAALGLPPVIRSRGATTAPPVLETPPESGAWLRGGDIVEKRSPPEESESDDEGQGPSKRMKYLVEAENLWDLVCGGANQGSIGQGWPRPPPPSYFGQGAIEPVTLKAESSSIYVRRSNGHWNWKASEVEKPARWYIELKVWDNAENIRGKPAMDVWKEAKFRAKCFIGDRNHGGGDGKAMALALELMEELAKEFKLRHPDTGPKVTGYKAQSASGVAQV